MKSNHPAPTPFDHGHHEIAEVSPRLQDEKISDESGADANLDSAFAPTGLDNPFWN